MKPPLSALCIRPRNPCTRGHLSQELSVLEQNFSDPHSNPPYPCGASPLTHPSGDTQFCANVTDGFVVTPSCVNIHVDNPGPSAVADTYTCAFNLVCSVTSAQGLMTNDASSVNLAFSVITGAPTASAGSVVVRGDGSFDWTPPSP